MYGIFYGKEQFVKTFRTHMYGTSGMQSEGQRGIFFGKTENIKEYVSDSQNIHLHRPS
jgi:hypothetical protein